MSYEALSIVYDRFTQNVDYQRRCNLLEGIFRYEMVSRNGPVLDAGCGTGNLSLLLAEKGYEMICADASVEMLGIASEKFRENQKEAVFINQKLQSLDLYGTVKACVSMLDVFNHIESEQELTDAFSRIALFMEPGSPFVFDMNTPYKHHEILGNSVYFSEDKDAFCCWRSEEEAEYNRVLIGADVFLKNKNNMYRRFSEQFYEYTYSLETVKRILEKTGFSIDTVMDGEKYTPLRENSERMLFVAKKV